MATAEVDVANDQRESAPTSLTRSDIPDRKQLADGSSLLAEATAFLVLERGVTKRCGSYVNEHLIQLVRLPTGGRGAPTYKLVVHPREGEGGVKHVVALDGKVAISPALKQLRRETHFVKPDGESLLRAINNMDGDKMHLYAFEVKHSSGVPLFDLLGVKQQVVGLGFKSLEEGLGWYIYIAACANMMSPGDPDFSKVLQHQQGLADHAAATRALMLNLDDTPERVAPAVSTDA